MKFSSNLKLEWKELERFDKSSDEDRSIVFYVENEHYTIYLKSLIETLVNEYGLKVSYVTSSKTDPLLKSTNKNISSFFPEDGDETKKMTLKAYNKSGPAFLSLKSDPQLSRSITGK